MAEIKTLLDEYGIIHEANKILPNNNLKLKFLEALAELEDNAALPAPVCSNGKGQSRPVLSITHCNKSGNGRAAGLANHGAMLPTLHRFGETLREES